MVVNPVPNGVVGQDGIIVRGLTTESGTRDLVIMGGVVVFEWEGGEFSYRQDDLVFKPLLAGAVLPSWGVVNRTVVMVSPNSILKGNQTDIGGWAVDGFRHELDSSNQLQLRVQIACWGQGNWLYRAAYHISAVGLLL
jgi:hypothetical protein